MEWIVVTVAVVLIVTLSATVQIVKMAMAHEEKRLALQAGQGDAGRLEQILAATQTEMARLKDRVQVLEKLVTDDDRRLASDIERLRSAEARG